MEIHEKKLGRVFRLKFTRGEDFFVEISKFVREKGIKEASLFVIGALEDGQMITGFLSNEGYNVNRRAIGHREFFGLGSLTWPLNRPPAVEENVAWEKAQPYAHIHLTLGPDVGVEQKEVLAGHLSKAIARGIFIDLYELL